MIEETYDRCENMEWNEELKMVVDISAGIETENIEDDENLVGFTFNASAVANTEYLPDEELPSRPIRPKRNAMPGDNDSISTLGGSIVRGVYSPMGRSRTTGSSSGASIQSTSSSVTLEQYNQLRDQVQRVTTTSNTQFTAINEKVSQILSSIASITTAT